MTTRERVVIRILLLVAKMFSDEAGRKEIEALDLHIRYTPTNNVQA